MFTKSSFLILTICLFSIANTAIAFTRARLSKVSGGEFHSMVLMEDGTLWACGGSQNQYQLGLGGNAYNIPSLLQVKGPDGFYCLEDIVSFDAGWLHSLAADSDGFCYSWGSLRRQFLR